MQTENINKDLGVIESALGWSTFVTPAEQLSYRQKLIKIRRELKKIKYAVEEKCSTAAFGESQMGKSYLVSAMLSSPDKPFAVTDGSESYNFIDSINPSSPNSTIEATGVITRFTVTQTPNIPDGYLKIQLLSVADIVLMLCEAFYNQLDYSHESLIDIDVINNEINSMTACVVIDTIRIMNEDELMNIQQYLSDYSIQKKCSHILKSDFFSALQQKLDKLSNSQITQALKLLWNNNAEISRLFDDLLKVYARLGFSQTVYAEFKGVLKKHGTLLDVARLDEMYGSPEAVGAEYINTVNVIVSGNANTISVEKSFFSALIAELCFTLPQSVVSERPFLKDLDILDFPGARRPEQIKEAKLGEGKNLSTILRRGKVSYLFNKYSEAKRISTLMFCHNNNQSAESTMGGLLTNWVYKSIGEKTTMRENYIRQSKISPLFIIGTWFNKDLEYQNEDPGDTDRINERWQRRFNVVLEKEVLKSLGDQDHWFNLWTDSNPKFNNIFMLRDFKYSKAIFSGYDAEAGTSESAVIDIARFPGFLSALRDSFVRNEFVQNHIGNPLNAWDEAASVGKDGTRRIISALSEIAPNVSNARDDKFQKDVKALEKELMTLLERFYHPESGDEQIKLAKRQAGSACLQIGKLMGKDPFFFGRMIDSMMINESEIYELVHDQVLGAGLETPMSSQESQIYIDAGLDPNESREENIQRLCAYTGIDDIDELMEYLEMEEGVDIDTLLSSTKVMSSSAEMLVIKVEELWYNKFLVGRVAARYKEIFPSIDNIVKNLWTVYQVFDVRTNIVEQVDKLMKSLDKQVCVGIIADNIAMKLNLFVSSFGYDYISTEEIEKLSIKNKELGLNIDMNMLTRQTPIEGIVLLENLAKQKDVLSHGPLKAEDREFLSHYPQYCRRWRWEQQLRLGFVKACSLPDYNVKANDELGRIIDKLKMK